jgi:hypothetical protein
LSAKPASVYVKEFQSLNTWYQVPISKLQKPNKFQISKEEKFQTNKKVIQVLCICLEFGFFYFFEYCLVLGVWSLEFFWALKVAALLAPSDDWGCRLI